jgi:chromate transporter
VAEPLPPQPTLREATRVWARIGALGFGGPAGQIALMHRVLVDEKRWISEDRFLHALNFCMLLPGPEAQQLATYIGWLMHGPRGGFVAGGLFVLPGVCVIMALSLLYATFGGAPAADALFFGLKAAVMALIAGAVRRLGTRTLTSRPRVLIAVAAFAALFLLKAPFPAVIVVAGAAGYFLAPNPTAPSPPPPVDKDVRRVGAIAALCAALWLGPVAGLVLWRGPDDVYAQIALFFSKVAVVSFGGAYAALAYVAQQAVDARHWLAPAEMLDGLGLAETTPGPLILVLQFVGFMAAFRDPGGLAPLCAGALGGLLAAWVTFAPSFLWIFAGAPFVERLRRASAISGALAGVAAAVVGVIACLALWFATHFLFRAQWTLAASGPDLPVLSSLDPTAAALSLAAALALWRGARPEWALLAGVSGSFAIRFFAG